MERKEQREPGPPAERDGSAVAQSGDAALIVRPRHGPPRRVPLIGRMMTIGRAKTADIVLSDPTVSSVHARIEPLPGGGHRLIDCHSRNGTKVNDQPATERRLELGDEVRVGNTVLVYARPDAALEEGESVTKTVALAAPRRPAPPVAALVDGDTTTVVVAPADFDIDFLEPRTVPADRTVEAALERRLTGLYRAAKTLTPMGDRAPVEPRFVKLAQDILGVMRVAVLRLHDPAKAPPEAPPALIAAEVRSPAEPFDRVAPEGVVLRESARTGRALLYRRPAARATEGRSTPSSAIVVSLDVDGDPGLVAYADVFEPWPSIHQDDLRLLGILARHAATCISNSRLQAQLLQANKDLEARVERRSAELIDNAKIAAVGTLAAGVAHEFNNALAVIMGNAELALHSGVGPDARDQVQTILDSARRARDIVRHLLTFSRRREPRREPVNVVEVVETTLRLIAAELNRGGIRVRRSFAAIPPVLGESGALSFAFLSLLKNARDAVVAKGGGEVHVAVRRRLPPAAGGTTYAVLELRDTGIGMTPEVRARLFEPFFTTKPIGQGTGLGLATAYGIVMNHGGSIEVDSEPGQGASFRIVLPLTQEDVSEVATDFTLDAAPPGADEGALHVLIVDDDAMVLGTLGAMIRRLKHHPTLLSSGPEALKVIEAARFDLVLADIGMAGMDGIALRGEILKRIPEQKLVLITGNAEVEDLLARNGIAGQVVLRKPIGLRELGELIARTVPRS